VVREADGEASGPIHLAKSLNMVPVATVLSRGEAKMKLAVLYVVVVSAILAWWLRGVRPKRLVEP
jgi:hypothetical protein